MAICVLSSLWDSLRDCRVSQSSAAWKQSLCAEFNERVLKSQLQTELFKRSGRSMKGGFISLGSSRCIFTQWAPEGRLEQAIFCPDCL